ncbi:hypothetical protein [Fusibacter sp. JL216-2]|uniref:hypothetical protein n=1 Tax=Fusibacter sp. JL216-2 TaxID=3071453 RepID=UPI003D3517D1
MEIYISFYYYCGLLIAFIGGVTLFIGTRQTKGKQYIKFRKRVIQDTKKKIGKGLSSPSATQLMLEAGMKTDSKYYNGIRYILTVVTLVIQVKVQMKAEVLRPHIFLLVAGIFLLTAPVESFCGKQMPFGFFMEVFKKGQEDQIDKEVFEAMTQLKNLCIAQADFPLSGDYMIEQVMKFSQITKHAYSKMLVLWRLGDSESACEVFAVTLNTKMSRELSSIFLKLESMAPVEMAEHLNLYQSHIREERMTKHLRKQEMMSYVLYAPVIASAFAIMLNFMVVVIWLDTMELMQKI